MDGLNSSAVAVANWLVAAAIESSGFGCGVLEPPERDLVWKRPAEIHLHLNKLPVLDRENLGVAKARSPVAAPFVGYESAIARPERYR